MASGRLLEGRVGVLEVESLGDLLLRLVEGVVDLVLLHLRDDVEAGHGEWLGNVASGRRAFKAPRADRAAGRAGERAPDPRGRASRRRPRGRTGRDVAARRGPASQRRARRRRGAARPWRAGSTACATRRRGDVDAARRRAGASVSSIGAQSLSASVPKTRATSSGGRRAIRTCAASACGAVGVVGRVEQHVADALEPPRPAHAARGPPRSRAVDAPMRAPSTAAMRALSRWWAPARPTREGSGALRRRSIVVAPCARGHLVDRRAHVGAASGPRTRSSPGLAIPAFSRAIASSVVPRRSMWSSAMRVMAAAARRRDDVGRVEPSAEARPRGPRGRRSASRKARNAASVAVSKKERSGPTSSARSRSDGERVVAHRLAVDADALGEAAEVRRRVEAGLHARGRARWPRPSRTRCPCRWCRRRGRRGRRAPGGRVRSQAARIGSRPRRMPSGMRA